MIGLAFWPNKTGVAAAVKDCASDQDFKKKEFRKIHANRVGDVSEKFW